MNYEIRNVFGNGGGGKGGDGDGGGGDGGGGDGGGGEGGGGIGRTMIFSISKTSPMDKLLYGHSQNNFYKTLNFYMWMVKIAIFG